MTRTTCIFFLRHNFIVFISIVIDNISERPITAYWFWRTAHHLRPPLCMDRMQHLVRPAGLFGGLMSICLSVPAVQVGGYSAQQV